MTWSRVLSRSFFFSAALIYLELPLFDLIVFFCVGAPTGLFDNVFVVIGQKEHKQ